MNTVSIIAVLILFVAGLYRANEINPKYTRKLLKLAVAGLLLLAFVTFFVVVHYPNQLILAMLSLLCLTSAVWLLGGEAWR